MTTRRVQLTSDGSHDPITRIAGWGCVVTALDGERAIVTGNGLIDSRCGSSNSAEAKAMAAALTWAVEAGHVRRGDALTLVTDCGRLYAELSGKRISARNRRRLRRGLSLPKQDTGLEHGSGRKVVAALLVDHDLTIEAAVQVKGHPSHAERKADQRLEGMHQAHRLSYMAMRAARVNIDVGQSGSAHLVARS